MPRYADQRRAAALRWMLAPPGRSRADRPTTEAIGEATPCTTGVAMRVGVNGCCSAVGSGHGFDQIELRLHTGS